MDEADRLVRPHRDRRSRQTGRAGRSHGSEGERAGIECDRSAVRESARRLGATPARAQMKSLRCSMRARECIRVLTGNGSRTTTELVEMAVAEQSAGEVAFGAEHHARRRLRALHRTATARRIAESVCLRHAAAAGIAAVMSQLSPSRARRAAERAVAVRKDQLGGLTDSGLQD